MTDTRTRRPIQETIPHNPINTESVAAVDPARLRQIAHTLMYHSLKLSPGVDRVVGVQYSSEGPTARALVDEVATILGETGIVPVYMPRETERIERYVNALARSAIPEEQKIVAVKEYASSTLEAMKRVDKVVIVHESRSSNIDDARLSTVYQEAGRQVLDVRLRKPWVLICPPTPESARLDGKSLDTALLEWLHASELDWGAVLRAQSILVNEILNPAHRIRVVADADNRDPRKRTDFSVDVSGQTFANSTIGHNFPGCEVYTGGSNPSGRIYFPRPLMFRGIVIPNLSVSFKEGVVEDFAMFGATDAQEQHVRYILTKVPGANKIGEFAIGTNPNIMDATVDILMNEKALGIHIAFGSSYEDHVDDAGILAHTDNGNRSVDHIDCTKPLGPENLGEIYADGALFFLNGVFVKPDGTPDARLAMISRR